MFKIITSIYIICFAFYVLFTRQPDYQDGEFAAGIIHYIKDSTQKPVTKAMFSINEVKYAVNAAYPLRHLQEGQIVKIIYDTTQPSRAAVYTCWGYWLQWDELLASILIPFVLFYAAKAITASPTPDTLADELEMSKPAKRRKYY